MTAYSFIIFFFSSRRRHTRFDCDWSSDVCSSDLLGGALSDRIGPARTMWIGWLSYVALAAGMWLAASPLVAWLLFLALGVVAGLTGSPERALVSAATGGHRGGGFGGYHALTGGAGLAGGRRNG